MKKLLLTISIFYYTGVFAQNDRVNDYNNTNWLQTFNTIKLDKKWSLHLEYQWRRTNGLKYWQQNFARAGANYKINEQVTVHAGYAFAQTFSYGDFPLAPNGPFPEHRIYEQLNLRQPVGKLVLSHRFRVEQRWIGQMAITNGEPEVVNWNFAHRFRYQFRAVHPLVKRTDKQPYLVAADEIFIGAGKNVGANIFDQNRIYLMLGYKFNDKISIEGGYFNQTLQQGRRVNGNTIMQRNNGLLLGSYLNL